MNAPDRHNRTSNAERAGSPGTGAPLRRVEEIFFEISAVAPLDREEAIVRACGGDAILEREVRSLVGWAGRAGSFLEQPALGKKFDQLTTEIQRPEPPDELIGTTLGSFTIERRLASGGMGTVYAASRSDGQFEQRVAVKVVKRGMDSEEILRRFRMERQTLAALDHPNIARLIDGGMTPDGRPFVVMEFIDGKPIDEYCDEKGLGLRERLRLFREVCAGVQHAHQNLVIHRDIKPSNILVTPQGVPKLLDFGIAKVISGGTGAGAALLASVTAETDRRLTPEYASPEQVEGAVLTTASDVYSLGVVLYELLTGVRPYYFNLRTSEEVRRVVCTLMPLAPSQAVTVRASRLRTDGSSPAPPGTGTDPRIPAIAGTRNGTHTASNLAPADIPKTRGVSSTRLRGLLRGDLDVITLMALRKEPERRYVSAEQFSADIERFLRGMPVQARRDTLTYRASKFVRRHGVAVTLAAASFTLVSASAVVLYRQSRELERQRADLLAANTRLDENNRRLTESRHFLQAVIGGAGTGNQGPEATLGDVLRESARALAAAPPSDPLTLAAAEEEVGRAMMSLGMLDSARPLLADADRLYSGLPPTADARMDSALNLAELAFYQGRYADAEQAFRALLAAERAHAPKLPSQRESAILNDLGAAVRAQGRTEDAIALQREALTVTIATHGEASLETAETRNNLASALLQHGDITQAADEFEKSYAVRKRLLRPGHPLLIRCESNLGLAKLRAGQVDEAITLLEAAATNWDAAFGPEHPGRVATMTALSQALRKQARFADALQWLNSALAWQREHQPAALDKIAATEANIGLTLAEQGEDDQAIQTLSRVLPQLRESAGSAAITRSAIETLTALYERHGQTDKARETRELLPSK